MSSQFFTLLIALCLHAGFLPAQNKQPAVDTSFSLHSALASSKKTNPEAALVPSSRLQTVAIQKDIVFASYSSRNLKLDIFYPKKSYFKKAAIIIVHGGGWRSGNRSMHHQLAETLAGLGYACFTPEYRLSGEAVFPAAVLDVKAAIRWVRANAKKYDIDPDQIAVAGHSAGGELAAFAGATANVAKYKNAVLPKISDRPNAVIDIDGTLSFVHPESGEGDDSKRLSAATQWFGEPKMKNLKLWEEASPLAHVGKDAPPYLFLTSSVARMHAGMNDFRKMLQQYNIFSKHDSFPTAPHSFIFFHPWFVPAVEKIDEFLSQVFIQTAIEKFNYVVGPNEKYKTIQAALNAIPSSNKAARNVYIKNGVYHEKVLLPPGKDFVTLVGEDKFRTIIIYNDHTGKLAPNGETIGTRTSWTFKSEANKLTAYNISFINDAGNKGQAVAVESDGDETTFINCRFIGNQDVLFLNDSSSRQYYQQCYIEGTTDFIFGASTAWFEQCHIHSKRNSHITAAATPSARAHGFVFNNNFITADTGLSQVSLGRPWRPFAKVVFMNTYLPAQLRPAGWSVWNDNQNHLNSFFAEYNNAGPGNKPAERLAWTKQLTSTEAANYSPEAVLGNWIKMKLNK